MRALAGDFERGGEDAAVANAIDLRAALAAHMNDADRRLLGHIRPQSAARTG
jgi:hemerythrin